MLYWRDRRNCASVWLKKNQSKLYLVPWTCSLRRHLFRLKEKEAEEARKRPASESTAQGGAATTGGPDQKQVKVENGDNEQKMKSGQDKKVNGIKPSSQPSEIDRLEPLTDVMIPTSR